MDFDVRDSRNRNWLWMRRELLREHGDELGTRGVAVYAALASFAGEDSTAYPSIGSLAEMLDVSENTVRKGLQDLTRLGWVGYENRTDDSGRQVSHMFYLLECPTQGSDSEGEGSNTEGGRVQPVKGEGSNTEPKVEPNEVEPNEVEHPQRARAREDSAPVELYHDIFPRRANNIQKEQMRERVDDLDRWKQVLKEWRGNGWSAKSVMKMLDKYENDTQPNGQTNEDAKQRPQENYERLREAAFAA